MASKADLPVAPVLARLGSAGLTAAPLIPTATGLAKGILDATRPIREALAASGLHEFATQEQGPGHKVEVPAFFVDGDAIRSTIATLYRPVTKQGDPRLWIKGLPDYAAALNLICLVPVNGALYVVNASTPGLLDRALAAGGVLNGLAPLPLRSSVEILLAHLRRIAAGGWIRAHVVGPTAIGVVVEHELGIEPNPREAPDYLGIEVKGRRLAASGGSSSNLQTLFSKTPVWALGAHDGGRALLDAHGYESGGILRLACTVAPTPNPQHLATRVVESPEAQVQVVSTLAGHACLVWPLDRIENKLATKHLVTAWVDADKRVRADGFEEFWLKRVEFSSRPAVHLIGPLIAEGAMTVDLTIREKGSLAVRDHGYLFRMRRDDLPALFPEPFVAHALR